MPGLIKVGKTTAHPDQRMSELHSTGVPTPFILEFSAEVDDCAVSERKAHSALSEYRVAKNREFFEISVKQALHAVLPVIGEYTIHSEMNKYGLKFLDEEVKHQQQKLKESRKPQPRPNTSAHDNKGIKARNKEIEDHIKNKILRQQLSEELQIIKINIQKENEKLKTLQENYEIKKQTKQKEPYLVDFMKRIFNKNPYELDKEQIEIMELQKNILNLSINMDNIENQLNNVIRKIEFRSHNSDQDGY